MNRPLLRLHFDRDDPWIVETELRGGLDLPLLLADHDIVEPDKPVRDAKAAARLTGPQRRQIDVLGAPLARRDDRVGVETPHRHPDLRLGSALRGQRQTRQPGRRLQRQPVGDGPELGRRVGQVVMALQSPLASEQFERFAGHADLPGIRCDPHRDLDPAQRLFADDDVAADQIAGHLDRRRFDPPEDGAPRRQRPIVGSCCDRPRSAHRRPVDHEPDILKSSLAKGQLPATLWRCRHPVTTRSSESTALRRRPRR